MAHRVAALLSAFGPIAAIRRGRGDAIELKQKHLAASACFTLSKRKRLHLDAAPSPTMTNGPFPGMLHYITSRSLQ